MAIPVAKQERFHFLDGLRGIASLMIVIHHSFTSSIVGLLNHLKIPLAGYYFANFTQSGVELFFVLSGVVLLRPYLRKQRKFNTLDYFIRRIKRIYPPYFFALIFASFVIWYIHAYPTWYTIKPFHMYFYWEELLKESVIINFDGGYYNLAWWSLGIEMLFYILVPFCIFIFPSREKINNRNMIVMILITLIVSTFLQLWLNKYYPQLYSYEHIIPTIYQSICYPVCFLMGMFLAAKDFDNKEAYIFILSGIILILASVFYLPIVNPGYGLVYAGIIILSFNVKTLKDFLSRPVMLWLGERSYSLFLTHFSVFYLLDSIIAHFTPGRNMYYAIITRGFGIPLAIFAAMLLFHFVERKQARGLVTGNMFWPWQVKKLDLKLYTNINTQ